MQTVKGYRLVWKNEEGRGEVHLFTDNVDAKPDVVIAVGAASELVAWDTLLNQQSMKNINDQGWLFTHPKSI